MRIGPSLGQSGPFQSLLPGKNTAGSLSVPLPQGMNRQNPLQTLQELSQWQANEQDTNRHSVRWPADKMPLMVWIDACPVVAQKMQCEEGLENWLFMALKQWEAASQGHIRFQFMEPNLSQREQADILITWSDETTLGRDYEVGHTNKNVNGTQIRQAAITLITQPYIDGHLSPHRQKQRLYTTVLHEAGHALGLEHSDYETDVMHHRGWQRTYLSENDAQRLQTLYQKGQRIL